MSAEDVRKLHYPFKIYDECEHQHEAANELLGIVEIDEIGLTCDAGLLYTVCRECDTDDGEVNENTEYGEWPCATLKALDKP